MAGEVSLETRMARLKLRTSLSLLSNASTRKAQQLREINDKVQIHESNIFWVVAYILVISFILLLLGVLFFVSR